jgi:hypothetical protein
MPPVDRRAAIVIESLHEAILLQVCLLVKDQVQHASEHQATSTWVATWQTNWSQPQRNDGRIIVSPWIHASVSVCVCASTYVYAHACRQTHILSVFNMYQYAKLIIYIYIHIHMSYPYVPISQTYSPSISSFMCNVPANLPRGCCWWWQCRNTATASRHRSDAGHIRRRLLSSAQTSKGRAVNGSKSAYIMGNKLGLPVSITVWLQWKVM